MEGNAETIQTDNSNYVKYKNFDSNLNSTNNDNFFSWNLHNTTSDKVLKSNNNDVKIYSKEGECFGDWDIINNTSKPTIGIATEESDLFVLDKDYFIDYLSKPIVKSESERKLFIKKILKPLMNFGFEDFYYKINPLVIFY